MSGECNVVESAVSFTTLLSAPSGAVCVCVAMVSQPHKIAVNDDCFVHNQQRRDFGIQEKYER